jgi:hypothetical protein
MQSEQRLVIRVAFLPQPRFGCRYEPLIQVLVKIDRRRTGKASNLAFLEFCSQVGLRLTE